jgi:transcriptional regulator with XRE-family HTH domain
MRNFSSHRGPTPFLNNIQQLRAHLGLSQQDLADLIRVSRTAVAMDERYKRSLPWPKSKMLLELCQVLPVPDGSAPLPAVPAPLLSAADREELDWRRRDIAREIYPTKQRLARVEVRLAQARLWQQALPALRAAFPASDTFAHQWLDHFVGKAAVTLNADSGQPTLLKLRLAAIAFEMAEIDRLLAAEPAAE